MMTRAEFCPGFVDNFGESIYLNKRFPTLNEAQAEIDRRNEDVKTKGMEPYCRWVVRRISRQEHR